MEVRCLVTVKSGFLEVLRGPMNRRWAGYIGPYGSGKMKGERDVHSQEKCSNCGFHRFICRCKSAGCDGISCRIYCSDHHDGCQRWLMAVLLVDILSRVS